MTLTEWRGHINKQLGALAHARTQCKEEKVALAVIREDIAHTTEGLTIAQGVAEEIQTRAHRQIADIVSRSLEAVFDEPYEFKILFEQKRGRTEASLVFEREGLQVDPMSASGGGVVDVAAFALRLSCLLLSRPPLQRLLVLDEPFRFVSVEYRERVRSLLETLAVELDCQFIVVTHQSELRTGTIVEL